MPPVRYIIPSGVITDFENEFTSLSIGRLDHVGLG